MRRRIVKDQEESEVNLTPMLDVVFIMLIFFIVTASFIKEAGLDVNRPDAPVTETKPEESNILVAMSASNTGPHATGRVAVISGQSRAEIRSIPSPSPMYVPAACTSWSKLVSIAATVGGSLWSRPVS